MLENAISPSSLYNPGSTLNYAQAAMMGLSGSHGGLQDPQQLSYPGHGGIPDIILTGVCPHLLPPPQPTVPPQLSPHSAPCTPLLTLRCVPVLIFSQGELPYMGPSCSHFSPVLCHLLADPHTHIQGTGLSIPQSTPSSPEPSFSSGHHPKSPLSISHFLTVSEEGIVFCMIWVCWG